MDKTEEVRQWFDIARQDYATAEHSFTTMYPIPIEPICFLCQQSAEKDLKGFLVMNNIIPPKTHDITSLLTLCIGLNPAFTKIEKQCKRLTIFGVIPRYPNELNVTLDDIKVNLKYAEEIKTFVAALVDPLLYPML
ncbi:MAG: HEPN domain-containing protein [Treponema sp.]|nr:HEPN domain-containing protein [Treponema sp.]